MWAEFVINALVLFGVGIVAALLSLLTGWLWMLIEDKYGDDDEPPFDGIVILTPMDELNEMMRQSFEDGWERRGRMTNILNHN